jgi:hypothetical protein
MIEVQEQDPAGVHLGRFTVVQCSQKLKNQAQPDQAGSLRAMSPPE